MASTPKRVLIVDSNIDKPWGLCADFRRYIEFDVEVRRAPEGDLPGDWTRYSHVVLSGSKTSCLEESDWVLKLIELVRKRADLKHPLLGVCFGHQMLARAHGGLSVVRASQTPEIGWTAITQCNANPLFEG